MFKLCRHNFPFIIISNSAAFIPGFFANDRSRNVAFITKSYKLNCTSIKPIGKLGLKMFDMGGPHQARTLSISGLKSQVLKLTFLT